jgi:hypothetical protein
MPAQFAALNACSPPSFTECRWSMPWETSRRSGRGEHRSGRPVTTQNPNRRQSRAVHRDSELPQRVPFIGPPAVYSGAPADVVERFTDAVHEWADQPVPTQSSRCRGVESPGTGPAIGSSQPRRRVDAVFPIGTSTVQPHHPVSDDCSSTSGACQSAIRRNSTK